MSRLWPLADPTALTSLGHSSPTLAPGTVHVWSFALEGDTSFMELCRRSLSAEERQRADRFVFDSDRMHHTIAHGVVRHLLGRYCAARPESLRFSVTAAGKPRLITAGGLPAALHFNLTHSSGRALLGVAKDRELGIDLEKVRDDIEALDISRHYFFGTERDAIEAAAEPGNTFFRYWVAKEAVLKAQGIGLGFPLDRFRVAFMPGDEIARIETLDPVSLSADWTVRMLPCESDWLAAVAARGTDWVVKLVTDPAHL